MTKFNNEKINDLDHLEGQIAALWARVNYMFDKMMEQKKKAKRKAKKK